jgi:hypothetical protein
MYGLQIGDKVKWKDRGQTQTGVIMDNSSSMVKVYNKDKCIYEQLAVSVLLANQGHSTY